MSSPKNALGLIINELAISAEEFDGENRRVGADAVVFTNDASRWLLQLMTKQRFADQEIGGLLEEREDPGTYIAAHEEGLTRRHPYVLNDTEITDEILRQKFIEREVRADLAEAMVFLEPDSQT